MFIVSTSATMSPAARFAPIDVATSSASCAMSSMLLPLPLPLPEPSSSPGGVGLLSVEQAAGVHDLGGALRVDGLLRDRLARLLLPLALAQLEAGLTDQRL